MGRQRRTGQGVGLNEHGVAGIADDQRRHAAVPEVGQVWVAEEGYPPRAKLGFLAVRMPHDLVSEVSEHVAGASGEEVMHMNRWVGSPVSQHPEGPWLEVLQVLRGEEDGFDLRHGVQVHLPRWVDGELQSFGRPEGRRQHRIDEDVVVPRAEHPAHVTEKGQVHGAVSSART